MMVLEQEVKSNKKSGAHVSADTKTMPGMCIHNLEGIKRAYPRSKKLPRRLSNWMQDIIDKHKADYQNSISEDKLKKQSSICDPCCFKKESLVIEPSYHYIEHDEELYSDENDNERRHWMFKSHCEYWYFACRCKFLKIPSQLGRYLWFQFIASCKPDEEYQKRFAQVFYNRLMYLIRTSSQLNNIVLFDYGMSLKWLDPYTKIRYLAAIERLIMCQKSLYIAGFEQAQLKPIEAIRLLLALSLAPNSNLHTLYAWYLFKYYTCPMIGYFTTKKEHGPYMKKELKRTNVKLINYDVDALISKKKNKLNIVNLIGPECKKTPKFRVKGTIESDSEHLSITPLEDNVYLDNASDSLTTFEYVQVEEEDIFEADYLFQSIKEKDMGDDIVEDKGENMGEDMNDIGMFDELGGLGKTDSKTSMQRWVQSLLLSGMTDKFIPKSISHDQSVSINAESSIEEFSSGNDAENLVSEASLKLVSSGEIIAQTETHSQITEEDISLFSDEYEESEIINLDGQIDLVEEEEDVDDKLISIDQGTEDTLWPMNEEEKVQTEGEPMTLVEENEIQEIDVLKEVEPDALVVFTKPSTGLMEDVSNQVLTETSELVVLEEEEDIPQEPLEEVLMTLSLTEHETISKHSDILKSEPKSSEEIMSLKRTDSESTATEIVDDSVDNLVYQSKPTKKNKKIEYDFEIQNFVDSIIASVQRDYVEKFVSIYIYDIITVAQEMALSKLISDELERNRPDICLLSEFKEVGLTKEHVKNNILSGIYFPLDLYKRKYYRHDPEGTRQACYDYLVHHQYSKIDIHTMRMIYRVSLASLNRLTKLCINFGYLADSTGETLLSIGAIHEGCLVELKLLCCKEEIPSSNPDMYTTCMQHRIPDLAWRKAKLLAPNLGVHLVMKALSMYVWHSRERLDNLIKRMLDILYNLTSFEYYGTLQFIRTMDEICLYFLQHKTAIKRLALYKIEDPCLGTKLRSEINERRDKYAPMFAARGIRFDMGTFSL